jgi:Fibronectin type III domain/Secretion system C-terminal sorting domain
MAQFFSSTWLRALTLILFMVGSIASAQSQGCSQPSNLNSNVLSSGTVALSWSGSSSAIRYVVQYRLGTTGVWTNGGTVTTTNQVLTGLLPERVYTWRVKADCSTFSSVATFNSGGGVGGNTACSQPSNQVVDVTSASTANLSWSAVEGALYYTVQYRANNFGTWTNAGSVAGTSISVSNLLANTEYGWRVKASCSVYSSVALFNTGILGSGGNTSCSQPSNTDALALSTTSVDLTWSAIQEAQNYTVQYRQGLSGAWITLAPTTATNLVLSGLLEGTEYSWQVKASCSDYSSQAVFTTGTTNTGGGTGGGSTSCSSPSNTNTLSVLPTSAVVEWEAQGGALDYTVQYRLQLGGSYTTVGTFTAATATITGLTPGTEYVWRVKANCSPYGSDVQFSTPIAPAARAISGRNKVSSAASLQVSPNPAMADAVQIRAAQIGGQLRILNTAGQVVVDQIMKDAQEVVSVGEWNNGLYLVQLRLNDGTVQNSKLVVAH